jgi:hypothetical protein
LQLVAAGWTADNFTITSFHLVVDKFSSQDDEYFGVAFFERGGSLIHARNWPLSSATLTSWERDFHSRYFFSIAHAIRPILRGRDIQRYGYNWGGAYLIAAAYDSHKYLEDTYPAIFNHLVRYEDKLKGRGQCQYRSSGKPALNKSYPGQHHWLELDNNPGQDYMDDFSKQKLIWKRIGSILRFAYDEKGYLGLDSTCIATGSHAKLITAYLNSLLGNYLLSFSPKTGTGDLIVSVQAIESILMPKNASCMDTQTIEDIFSNTDYPRALAWHTDRFDEQLFEHFGLSSTERRYIKEIVMQYRG